MWTVGGTVSLCNVIHTAWSRVPQDSPREEGKGGKENGNFLNSLNPKRPRGQVVTLSAPNHPRLPFPQRQGPQTIKGAITSRIG